MDFVEESDEFGGMVGLNAGGSSADGVGPGGRVVIGAEAVDEDAFVGVTSEGDDLVLEVAAVEGDDLGSKGFEVLGEDGGGDGFGHRQFGVSSGGESGEQRETAIDDRVGEHVVAAKRGKERWGVDLLGIDIDAAAAAEEGEGLVEGGKGEADLGEGEVGDGTAFDGSIMPKDKLSVAGGADVEFNIVAAESDGRFDSG